MTVYIQIRDDENGQKLILPPESAKTIIDEMVMNVSNGSDKERYIFQAVEMDEEVYKSLPEFQGF